LANLGNAAFKLKQYEKAKTYHEQALAVSRELKDRVVEGRTHYSLRKRFKRSVGKIKSWRITNNP
jgi:uncharacterized protein HemY